jgi:dTDP-4-dehydrorhamnose reductase
VRVGQVQPPSHEVIGRMPGARTPHSRGISLVVGADGLIGRALIGALAACGAEVIGTSRRRPPPPGRTYLDLADDPEGWTLPGPTETAYLCAAVTSQDLCVRDPAASLRVNVCRTVALARQLVASGGFVLFLSTNLVYDGSVPHRRSDDPVCPTTEYGRQKAEAERRLLAIGDGVAVVRLTKVLAAETPVLAKWRIALRSGESIHPFSDMVMAPVSPAFVVDALVRIARSRSPGIFQISSARDVTYAQAAERLAALLGASPDLVRPVEAVHAGISPEAIPAHTTLDTTPLRDDFGLAAPDVWEAIDLAVGP